MGVRSREGRDDDSFACPHCGAVVPADALACSECGSDEETGWAEDAEVWAADIPTGYGRDGEFDYDEFAAREFGDTDRSKPGARRRVLVLSGVLLVGMLILAILIVAASR